MDAALDLRSALLLVATSTAFTALCPLVYRRDPSRRKLFLAALTLVLLIAPWWSTLGLWTWPLGLAADSVGALARPVPWVLLITWWAVGTVLVLRTLVRVSLGRRELAALPTLGQPDLDDHCRRLAQAVALRRPVHLREGHSPCASSLLGNMLVLPAAARGWSATAREAVLCHELTHLKRMDDRLMLLVRLLIDWYWWMPWLRGVRHRYLQAMEESCDDLASRLLGSRERYVAGLVEAARSLRLPPADHPTGATWPAWVQLLGHSHLAQRLHRLLAVPRPTLRHADGRWALLWVSLAFVILLTARPAIAPVDPPGRAELLPLRPLPQREARVSLASFVEDPRSGRWHRLTDSARNPLPIYPAAALEQGLSGKVTILLDVRLRGATLVAIGQPTFSSSDASGVLTTAVERALGHTRGGALGAGLRVVSTNNNDLPLPPPGSTLRLRAVYTFALGDSAVDAAP